MGVDAATFFLTDLALLLLLGLVLSLLAKKLNVNNILFLVVAGILLGVFLPEGAERFSFSSSFLVSLAVLTLVMVIFDGASRFELRSVNRFSSGALKVTLLFIFLNILVIAPVSSWLLFGSFSAESVLFAVLLSFVLSGTDPGSVFIMLKSKTNRVIEFLEVEAILNTPIMVVLPFIILDVLQNVSVGVADAIAGQFIPLLQEVVVGVGAGVIVGIVVIKTMRHAYSQRFSPVGLITASLLTYILAENLQGNGVLAVATLGLFFGNVYVKEKESLQEFNSMLSNSLTVLVFLLIGLIIRVQFSLHLFLVSILIFLLLLATRFTTFSIFFSKGKGDKRFNLKERLFMACSMPKGIAVAVVAFSLSVFAIPASLEPFMDVVVQLIVLEMVYSILLSTVIDRYSQRLIRVKLEENKQ
ncbi:MAG: cation:proton antiporter [Candidatus Woesearchaeota archaeon]